MVPARRCCAHAHSEQCWLLLYALSRHVASGSVSLVYDLDGRALLRYNCPINYPQKITTLDYDYPKVVGLLPWLVVILVVPGTSLAVHELEHGTCVAARPCVAVLRKHVSMNTRRPGAPDHAPCGEREACPTRISFSIKRASGTGPEMWRIEKSQNQKVAEPEDRGGAARGLTVHRSDHRVLRGPCVRVPRARRRAAPWRDGSVGVYVDEICMFNPTHRRRPESCTRTVKCSLFSHSLVCLS